MTRDMVRVRVLAFDTALNACSVALMEDGVARKIVSRPMSAGHAEHLAPIAAALFNDTGIAPLDLDRIGAVVGPGQFAGVRIGLAFTKGLALGGRARVLGVSSLEALAESLGGAWDVPRAAVIDARRGEVYAALYAQPGSPLLNPAVVPLDRAVDLLARAAVDRPIVVCGSGAGLLTGLVPAAWRLEPALVDIDICAVARLVSVGDPALRPAQPLYLRPPDAAPAKPSRFALIGPAP